MLDALHLVRKAARAGELDLVFGLVLAVAAAALRLPEDGGGQGVFTRDLGDIVDDAAVSYTHLGTRGAARPRDRAGKGTRPRAAHPDAADEK